MEQRMSALSLYQTWGRGAAGLKRLYPWEEDTAYRHIKHVQMSGVVPSRAERFRQAVGWSLGALGMGGATEALESRRCGGVLATLAGQAPYKGATDQFTVKLVEWLVEALHDESSTNLTVN